MMRNRDAFLMVKDQLTPDAFEDEETGRVGSLIWTVLKEYYTKHEELPVEEVFLAELENRLSLTDEFDDAALEAMDEFLDAAYRVADSDLKLGVAMKYLSQMLTEKAQKTLVADLQHGVVEDLPALLQQKLAYADAAKAMTSGAAPLPFPEKIDDITPLVLEPTGVGFLDVYMNGGMARKEVNGFCGPYGSCKTTLGIQLAIERARWAMHQWRLNGSQGTPQRVYFFSWEEGLEQLQPRVLSYSAQILRASLEGDDFQDKLSNSSLPSLKKYEREIYKDQIQAGVIMGERDRIKSAMKELNHNFRIIDFSGAMVMYQAVAGEMVDGMVTAIKQDQRLSDNPGVAGVIVDYAGAAAERAIMAGKADRKDLRHLIGRMPLALKNLVASPFDCHVWCLHQLGTEANARDAGVAPKSTDAAEARNFFENVNFGFMVGKPDTNNMTVLSNGKQRRATRRENIVVHIRGELSRVEDASKRYTVEDDMIVPRTDAGQFIRPERRAILRSRDDIGLD